MPHGSAVKNRRTSGSRSSHRTGAPARDSAAASRVSSSTPPATRNAGWALRAATNGSVTPTCSWPPASANHAPPVSATPAGLGSSRRPSSPEQNRRACASQPGRRGDLDVIEDELAHHAASYRTLRHRMSVQISPVRGVRDLRAFVDLPFRLHAGTPWVTPLRLERYAFLTQKLNAYFTHGRAQYFLARRGGRVVGRITAQVDHEYNRYHDSRTGMFGFLELEDDQEVADALIGTAEGWLRAQGCDRMLGPMNFQINDEAGVLIEGYDRAPLIREPWNPPYYVRRCERAGLSKAMDLLGWDLDISDRERMDPRLARIAQRARDRYGVTIRPMSFRHLRAEMDEFARVYNAAWSHNWGFTPYTEADLDAYTLDMRLVFDPDWFMIAELDSKTIAMAITIPDVNQILVRMGGRLLPLGWWHYLRRKHIVDRIRVGFLGVLPEYEHTGVAAALYVHHFETAAHSRCQHGEASFILETNSSMNRGLQAMGGRVDRRWRVYGRALS